MIRFDNVGNIKSIENGKDSWEMKLGSDTRRKAERKFQKLNAKYSDCRTHNYNDNVWFEEGTNLYNIGDNSGKVMVVYLGY